MSGNETIQPQESLEVAEVTTEEMRGLDDVTYEHRAYVEQSGDYQQSEAVQQNFETVVGKMIAAENSADMPATAKGNISDGKSEGTVRDPLTGKGGDNQGGSSGGESSDNPVMDQATEGKTPSYAISDSKKVGRGPGGEVPSSEIDGNDPIYEVDSKESDTSGAISAVSDQPEGKTGEIDPQRIGDGQLPQEKQLPFGKGKDGLLFPGGGKGLP